MLVGDLNAILLGLPGVLPYTTFTFVVSRLSEPNHPNTGIIDKLNKYHSAGIEPASALP